MSESSTNGEVVTQHLQDSFVYFCISSDEFLGLVRPVLLPGFFTSNLLSNCVRICYDYWDMFKRAPADHFYDELTRRLPDIPSNDRPHYVEYLDRLRQMPEPNMDYVVKRINRFVKCREYEKSAVEFAELVHQGRFDEAESLMLESLKSGLQKENVGQDYLRDLSLVHKRGVKEEFLIPTGVEALDQLIGGYRRGSFICFLGGYKGKKSWALIHLAKTGLLNGKQVLYVTHEMSADQVEKRLDMCLGAMVSSREAKEVKLRLRQPDGAFVEQKEIRPSIFDDAAVAKTRQRVSRLGGRIIIKKYPMGTCSMSELNRYLNYLERYENFIPDLIINDYADLMEEVVSQEASPRQGINQVYIGHKAIADERGILVATVSQATREAIRKRRVTMKDFSEDIRKVANVDLAIALCQTDEMAGESLLTMQVIANRDDVMDVGCQVLMNLNIGQFCVTSWIDR